jgi:hypothetical protein
MRQEAGQCLPFVALTGMLLRLSGSPIVHEGIWTIDSPVHLW